MRVAAALFPLILLAGAASARELTPAERRELPYDAQLPACEDPYVLGEIADAFATRENRFWNSSLRIVSYERLQPTSWRPWGLDFVPRRFCSGVVLVSDGVKRRIDYSIGEDLGTIGAIWGVDWCVAGLDRHYAHAPACKTARP